MSRFLPLTFFAGLLLTLKHELRKEVWKGRPKKCITVKRSPRCALDREF